MSDRTAMEIANALPFGVEPDMYDVRDAVVMLRHQHAEIERLASINSALVEKSNAYVIENARQAEEIEILKRERHHIYDLLARIHMDGGQYAAEHGIEKACDDAEAQVVTWLETINSVDDLIEQARIAEREACAAVCESCLDRDAVPSEWDEAALWCARTIRARAKK